MPFYSYHQSNPGGNFDSNQPRELFIEAKSGQEADDRASKYHVYFNGCEDGIDCNCCGDRWYSNANSWSDHGSETPILHGYEIRPDTTTKDIVLEKPEVLTYGFDYPYDVVVYYADDTEKRLTITQEDHDHAKQIQRDNAETFYGFSYYRDGTLSEVYQVWASEFDKTLYYDKEGNRSLNGLGWKAHSYGGDYYTYGSKSEQEAEAIHAAMNIHIKEALAARDTRLAEGIRVSVKDVKTGLKKIAQSLSVDNETE